MNIVISVVWTSCFGMTVIISTLFSDYGFDWTILIGFGIVRSSIATSLRNLIIFAYVFIYSWLFIIHILPSVTMICVYGKIFTLVMKQVRNIEPSTIGNSCRYVFTTSVKAAKNLFIICAAYLISYFPFFFTLVPGIYFSPWYLFASHWLYLYSSAVNASLYIILNHGVWKEMKCTFFFWKERRENAGARVERSSDRRSNVNPSIILGDTLVPVSRDSFLSYL